MKTSNVVQLITIATAATILVAGSANAKAFFYYKSDGTCVNDDTVNHADLNANGNGFVPGGGWGTCPKLVREASTQHQHSRNRHNTHDPIVGKNGDVLGSVKKASNRR